MLRACRHLTSQRSFHEKWNHLPVKEQSNSISRNNSEVAMEYYHEINWNKAEYTFDLLQFFDQDEPGEKSTHEKEYVNRIFSCLGKQHCLVSIELSNCKYVRCHIGQHHDSMAKANPEDHENSYSEEDFQVTGFIIFIWLHSKKFGYVLF